MRTTRLLSGLFLVPAMAAAVAACDSSQTEPEADALLDAVRAGTVHYQDSQMAAAAGYVADGHCVAHPDLGGMGDHWVNQDLVDPVFDPLNPEALLYAPGAGGAPELVGVEYIVIDVGQEHPDFDGQPFDIGGVPPLMEAGVDHWSLHVWLFLDNPAGMFTPFNPDLSCD